VALGKAYTKPVVFISGSPLSDPEAEPSLRGTGFLVGFRSEVNPDQGWVYIVTAAHVVRPLVAALVRMSKPDGSVADHAIEEWFFHPADDIAVARLPPPYSDYEFYAVEAKDLVGTAEPQRPPQPGADVYIAGLLRVVPAMGEQNIPMVRTGSVGALYQDNIPMRLPDETLLKVHGHLIDCQSFGGFSGSPCFVRYLSGSGKTEGLEIPYPIESTLLLGMVGGHFDLQASVGLPEGAGNLKVPVAAGVAVVYPAETIKEVLDTGELVQDRADLDAQLAEEKAASMTDEAEEAAEQPNDADGDLQEQ
jgi:Trypsin-like peptidase domain